MVRLHTCACMCVVSGCEHAFVCVHVYAWSGIEPICFHLKHAPFWQVKPHLHVVLSTSQGLPSPELQKESCTNVWLPIPMYPSPGQELGFPGGHFLCLQLDSMRPAMVHGSPRRAFWESLGGAWSLSSHPHWGIRCSSEPCLDRCWAVWIRRESVTRTQRLARGFCSGSLAFPLSLSLSLKEPCPCSALQPSPGCNWPGTSEAGKSLLQWNFAAVSFFLFFSSPRC